MQPKFEKNNFFKNPYSTVYLGYKDMGQKTISRYCPFNRLPDGAHAVLAVFFPLLLGGEETVPLTDYLTVRMLFWQCSFLSSSVGKRLSL